MIIGLERIIRLLIGIVIVLILLGVCITIDSAEENITIDNTNMTQNITTNESYIGPKNSGQAISDGKIYTVKEKTKKQAKKQQTITMTGKPSCSRCAANHCSYTWRTKTYINYCPNCHRYRTLTNKHKWQSRYEQEISCSNCDSDFCINCGKEKYSWSGVYLTQA